MCKWNTVTSFVYQVNYLPIIFYDENRINVIVNYVSFHMYPFQKVDSTNIMSQHAPHIHVNHTHHMSIQLVDFTLFMLIVYTLITTFTF